MKVGRRTEDGRDQGGPKVLVWKCMGTRGVEGETGCGYLIAEWVMPGPALFPPR